MAAAAEGLEVGLYVANAGSESGGHGFLDTPIETIRELIARNVLTTTEALHIFARPMRERGRGGIVLLGSGAGLGGQPRSEERRVGDECGRKCRFCGSPDRIKKKNN